MSEDLSTETSAAPDSVSDSESVSPPNPDVEVSDTESDAAEPVAVEPTPDPAEQRRARTLAIAARERTKSLRALEEAKATRAEADRIMAEARKIQERGEKMARIFEAEDPIAAMRDAGLDPEKTIYGLNDLVLTNGTPEARARQLEAKLAAIEARDAQREQEAARYREEQQRHHVVSAFQQSIAQRVEAAKDKYVGIANMDPRERDTRVIDLARQYINATGNEPTAEIIADGLEYYLRVEYDKLRGFYESNPVTPSSAAGDGRRDPAPGTPKLTSKLASTIATPPRIKSEDEEREEWAAEIRAARANGAR